MIVLEDFCTVKWDAFIGTVDRSIKERKKKKKKKEKKKRLQKIKSKVDWEFAL